jgi:hypothetical protein
MGTPSRTNCMAKGARMKEAPISFETKASLTVAKSVNLRLRKMAPESE